MRTITFRGKHRTQGYWVFGGIKAYAYSAYIVGEDSEKYEVDPDTVGQYTGIKDRNGAEIYEGDIVRYKVGYAGNPQLHLSEHMDAIKWLDRFAGFSILDDGDVYEIVVVGNIHDNPELAKGGER